MTSKPLDGRAALVTGASSGLGRHFAITLAAAGARVAVAARRRDRLCDLVAQITDCGGHAVPVSLDVRDPQSVRDALDVVIGEFGAVNILVNNAGITAPKPALEIDEADWNAVIGTNLSGAWRVATQTARHMVRAGQGGTIINIASILGRGGVTRQLSSYAISKAGVVAMTKALALDLARDNIRVNAIAPGYIETDFNRDFFASDAGKAMISRIPQRRLGLASDLDAILLLLAGEGSAFMTGSIVTIDGGHSLAIA
jgi:NAD(P)-dependent dehydrogenase (short-subunit alcohol dehydrogenase family)